VFSARELMATVSWERKGVLIVEFIQQETTITSEVYCETIKTCVGNLEEKSWNADIQCRAFPLPRASDCSCPHSSTARAFQFGVVRLSSVRP
jgi:hypothetical protein